MVRAEHLLRLRAVISRRLGLSLDESRDVELGEILARRLGERGRRDASAYLDALETSDEELRAIGQLLTVGETCFFRSSAQFDVLREVVLPARPRSRGEDLRLLSAGCSSGEEAYSLAIFMCEWERRCEPATWLRWHVRGVDLSGRSLAKAAAGVYSAWSLRETSAELRERYFTTRGREHELRADVRARVTFEQRNLLDASSALSAPEAFDAIFCRNVLMYFTPDAARAVVARLTAALAPGGVLFLGHAESLRGLSNAYSLESSHGAFYYRRPESRPVTAPASAPRTAERAAEPLAPPRAASPARVDPPAVSSASQVHLDAVRELVSRERFDEALDALTRVPSFAGAEVGAAVLRAVAHLGAGDVDAAESASAHLLAADEGSAEAHLVLALVAEHRGDRAKAIEHHRAAIYLEPDFALSHLHLGRIQRREGRIDEARHELGQALDLLAREEPSRLVLFGGGFGRAGLVALCRTELATLGGAR
ncbi:MAG: chemotaxis protein CheR [Labilithrix sp.]|nr:chemotaxis protein CheR [Labilithrix sp.]